MPPAKKQKGPGTSPGPRKLGPPGQESAESEAEGSTPENSDEDYEDDEGMLLSALAGSTADQPVSVDDE